MAQSVRRRAADCRAEDRVMPLSMAERYKAASNLAEGHGCLCCLMYSKDIVTRQDNHDKETSTEKVQREKRVRN
jgi:hypothetical protein